MKKYVEANHKSTALSDNVDDAVLQANGHISELKRQFNWISALGLGFSITNSWAGYLVSDLALICYKI
jgi:choline transport protein